MSGFKINGLYTAADCPGGSNIVSVPINIGIVTNSQDATSQIASYAHRAPISGDLADLSEDISPAFGAAQAIYDQGEWRLNNFMVQQSVNETSIYDLIIHEDAYIRSSIGYGPLYSWKSNKNGTKGAVPADVSNLVSAYASLDVTDVDFPSWETYLQDGDGLATIELGQNAYTHNIITLQAVSGPTEETVAEIFCPIIGLNSSSKVYASGFLFVPNLFSAGSITIGVDDGQNYVEWGCSTNVSPTACRFLDTITNNPINSQSSLGFNLTYSNECFVEFYKYGQTAMARVDGGLWSSIFTLDARVTEGTARFSIKVKATDNDTTAVQVGSFFIAYG